MELNREWTFLGMVVNVVVEIVAPLAQKRRIALVNDIPENLPKLYFDPVRIKQVLYNLLSNAIKFTPEGGSVRLSAVIQGNELEVSCADSGIGIAAEDLPRLFREFEQIGADSTRRAEGTGLGLALTKRFIELHGGAVRVESKVGQGSRFSFALPMLRGDLGPPPPDTPVPSPLEPVVLVVEDDAYAVALIAEHLRAAGLAVATASNAADALRLAQELKPAAITLDVMMAGMDGWGILTELRAHPATRAVPVVIISVVDEPNRGLVLGATDYLVKPVSRDALLQSLETAGVPLQRISGLKVVIAGKEDGDLENAAGHLKHAGCVVRRLEHFSPRALAEQGEIDAFLVELGADAVGELQALIESAEDFPFPIIAIVDAAVTAGKTWRGEVARLGRSDVLAVERLVRCIRRSVDKRRERRSSASIGAPARNGRK
jgi:CheY-like chemotaxis protein